MREKELRITNIPSFLKKISPMYGLTIFRGQTSDWPLLPSIGRHSRIARGYSDWKGFHDYIIEEFLRFGRPHFTEYPKTKVESWILAQHHGVPTRLLDATTNPLKALYFAVNNPVQRGNGVVWAIRFKSWRTDLSEEFSHFWEKELCPFLPAQYTPRLTAQEGAFILCPLPENKKPMVEINKISPQDIEYIKFIVPKKLKPQLRRELDILGCNDRLLFPDLDGVARGLKLSELDI